MLRQVFGTFALSS